MNQRELLNLVCEIGYLLLQSGAEIYRVEESIRRILAAYGAEDENVIALHSCIIVTIPEKDGTPVTQSKRLYQRDLDFDLLIRLNHLCRQLCRETPAIPNALASLQKIRNKKKRIPLWQAVCSFSLVSFLFVFVYGGSPWEAFYAGISGILVKLFLHLLDLLGAGRFFTELSASASASILCLFAPLLFPARPELMIVAISMNLAPGVAITNSAREIISGDLYAGLVRMAEAMLTGLALALGAGLVLSFARIFLGG